MSVLVFVSFCLNLITSARTGLTVGELLKKARVVKEERWKADVEELKKAAENIRKQSNLPPRDEKGVNGQMPKGGNDQICSKNERKDAPPYKVPYDMPFFN